jgi:hypothetical protein
MPADRVSEAEQLAAFARIHRLLDEDGEVYTPLREGRGAWPDRTFEDDVLELHGVHARVIGLDALKRDKSEARDDPLVAAKDRADMASLSGLG